MIHIRMENLVETKKSQLLSSDGSEMFRKDLIQLCFESWEVDDERAKDVEINSEIRFPSSLFVDKNDGHSDDTMENIKSSLIDRNRKLIDTVDHRVLTNDYGNDPTCVLQRFSGVFDDDEWKINCSRTLDIRGRKPSRKKKLKAFSFYKHSAVETADEPDRRATSRADGSATCSTLEDLWKYKKWLDSVEMIKKKQGSDRGDLVTGTCASCSLDDEANQLERRVRKLIESLKEKERSPDERRTAIGGGSRSGPVVGSPPPSNRVRHFFRNAFRGGYYARAADDELDVRSSSLDDYAEYVENRLRAWWTLLRCLENVRRTTGGDRENRKSSEHPAAVRKSLSDTDLAWTAGLRRWDDRTSIVDRDRRWDADGGERLWKERRDRFRTAVARLEYVGSTFREPCRLAGLKTLCEVEALAGAGRHAEAVNLFVSALPLSKSPEVMIRKAEAAYDWEFFCHLSMWRHSYKDEAV